MNLNLFEPNEPDCDHLPVGQRKFIGDYLVCTKCNEPLRRKDSISLEEESNG